MASAAANANGQIGTLPDTEDKPHLTTDNYWLLVLGIMGASTLQVIDSTVANVALPHMQTALGATRETITWVLTSYIVASAVALPATGWLADMFGGRRLMIVAVVGFIIASMLCGMAQNLTQMVLFRSLQGLTGAFIMPLSQAFILDITRPSRHSQMMGLWGMGVTIGPILGPILGGWLTESANWRWVFYINLPLGILSLAALVAFLPHRERIERRFDFLGFTLLAISLSALQLLLDRGSLLSWFESGEIWIYCVIALSAGWMAAIHLATDKNPLFDTALMKDRNFTFALCFMLVVGVILISMMALLPPMLQNLFGYGVINTGIVLMPRGIGVLISMILVNNLSRRNVDPRVLISSGCLTCALSLWQMAHWSLAVDETTVLTTGLLQGIGLGLTFIPLQSSAFATLSPRFRTDGSSLLNLSRSLGGSIGISLLTAIWGANLQTSHSDQVSNITATTFSMFDVTSISRFQSAGDMAIIVLDAEINRQASMVAYVNDFYLMMWLALAIAPLAFLMKRHTTPPPHQ